MKEQGDARTILYFPVKSLPRLLVPSPTCIYLCAPNNPFPHTPAEWSFQGTKLVSELLFTVGKRWNSHPCSHNCIPPTSLVSSCALVLQLLFWTFNHVLAFVPHSSWFLHRKDSVWVSFACNVFSSPLHWINSYLCFMSQLNHHFLKEINKVSTPPTKVKTLLSENHVLLLGRKDHSCSFPISLIFASLQTLNCKGRGLYLFFPFTIASPAPTLCLGHNTFAECE